MRKTYTTTYDEAGRVDSAGDGVNDRVGDHNRLTGQPPSRRDAENTTRSPGFSASPRLGGSFPRVAPYCHAGNDVRKTLDTGADGTIEESRVFVHDAGQIGLDLVKTGVGDAAGSAPSLDGNEGLSLQ